MSTRQYIAKRLLVTVFLMWALLTMLFVFIKSMPGSYVDMFIMAGASDDVIAAIESQWGLDQPLHVQYWRFLLNYLQLDPGTSLTRGTPVIEYVQMGIFNSLILVAPAITFAYILGFLIGGMMGYLQGSNLEKYGLIPVLTFASMPEFVLGILLIIIFSSWLGIFPSSGMFSTAHILTMDPNAPWWRPYASLDFIHHYILPFSVIVAIALAGPTLIMRTSTIEVKGQDFFQYHRLTGLSTRKRIGHLFKHASLPVITLYPITLTQSIGGLVILETVFNWPGIGYILVQSVFDRDFPVVIFILFLIGAVIIIGNLIVDLIYGRIDPRVSLK